MGVLLVPALLGSCSSGGSKSSGSGRPSTCALVTKLDEIANSVARADVRDPVAFKKTLDTAVRDYVANVRALRAVAPAELQAGLNNVEADVQQHRFDAALTDRVALDAYAARECGRTVQTVTTTTLPGTTSVPSSSAPSTGG